MPQFVKLWFDECGNRTAAVENHGAFIQDKIRDDAHAPTPSSGVAFGLQHLGWVRTTVAGDHGEIEYDPRYVQADSWAAAASYLAKAGARRFRIRSRCRSHNAASQSLAGAGDREKLSGEDTRRAEAIAQGVRDGHVIDLTKYTSPSDFQSFDSSEAFRRGATLILIGLQQRLEQASFISKRRTVEAIEHKDMQEIIIDWHYHQGRVYPEEWNRFWMSENIGHSIVSTVSEDMEIRYDWIGEDVPLPSNQTRRSLAGMRILDLAEPDYAARTWLHYEDVVKNKQPTVHEVELCVLGKVFEYTRLALPCLDSAGQVSHVISNSWVSNVYDLDNDFDTASQEHASNP